MSYTKGMKKETDDLVSELLPKARGLFTAKMQADILSSDYTIRRDGMVAWDASVRELKSALKAIKADITEHRQRTFTAKTLRSLRLEWRNSDE